MDFLLQYIDQHLGTLLVSSGVCFFVSAVFLCLGAMACMGWQGTRKGSRLTAIGITGCFVVLGAVAFIIAGVPAAIGAEFGVLAFVLIPCLAML